MIDLSLIEKDDVVTVMDSYGNRATGHVITVDPFTVGVFGTGVPFARRTRTGSVAPHPTVTVVAHQPQLVTEP